MGKTLVVIGEHNEEIRFGEHLRDYIEAMRPLGVVVYSVKNSFPNGSSNIVPSGDEIRAAEEEILGIMSHYKPNVTINIHTGESRNAMCITELIALHEYERLQPIRTADCLYPVDNYWTIWIDKFTNIARDSALQTQREFPFLSLEMWLDSAKNKPLYEREVVFAAHVIKQISKLYS